MVLIAVRCPDCRSHQLIKRGKTETGKPRYGCHNPACPHHSLVLNPTHNGRLSESKQQVVEMSLKVSGRRDIARVVTISPDPVINE